MSKWNNRVRNISKKRNNNKPWNLRQSPFWLGAKNELEWYWVIKTRFKIKNEEIISELANEMYCDKLSYEMNVAVFELEHNRKVIAGSFDRTHSIHKKKQTRERKWERKCKDIELHLY